MDEPFILALDQGTTGSTALLFDAKASLVGRAYSEFRQFYPRPGWVEHDAEEIFDTTLRVAREAIRTTRIRPEAIAAIGITNQRETVLLWDRRTGKPVSRAIVWQCRRTSEECERLKAKGLETEVREKTGLLLDPYFSATKIAWLLDRKPALRKKAERGELAAGTIDSWLAFRLSGKKNHVTDATNASRTLLFDIHERRWSPRLCEIFRVPPAILPRVLPSAADFGVTERSLFKTEIPLCAMVGDQQAALFGQGAVEEGQAKCTFGTGAFAMVYTGSRAVTSAHGLLTTLACDPQGQPAFAVEGSVFIAGAVVQWLRDGLGIIRQAKETEALARSVPDTGGVHFVPAFVGLGAPYWDPGARGAIYGLTRGTTRAHLVRAGLEAIAFQTADLLDAASAEFGRRLGELKVDGGAAANGLLLQTLADLLQIDVIRPPTLEMTGFGAARLAAIHRGIWDPRTLFRGRFKRFRPSIGPKEREERMAGWREAVRRTRSGAS